MEAFKLGNIEEAAEAANEMCTLLAAAKINDPLVEVDNAGKLVSIQLKVILSIFMKLSSLTNRFLSQVCFEKNSKESQALAKYWVQGVLRYDLRSFQLGFRIMSISHKYPRQVFNSPMFGSDN